MNQRLKDLMLFTILVQAYEEEYDEQLVTSDWYNNKVLEVFGVDSLDEIDGDQLDINLKFYVNYEIMRLKNELEKGQ